MRLADKPEEHSEIEIAAEPARVWELVTDIGLPARLSPELQRVEWLDGATTAAVGARFAGFNRNPRIGEWRTVSEIVEFDPHRAFGWAVLDADGRYGEPADDPADALAIWRFTLEPTASGTLLRQSVRIGTGNSGLTVVVSRTPDMEEQMIKARFADLHTGMDATLGGIKSLAEEGR
jgi:carbon monoxide dehydrogenase subunit G